MIAVVDYGVGNLFSVKNALRFLGIDCVFTSDKHMIEKCSSVILPGDGAFPPAMNMLNNAGLTEFLREQAAVKPFLGICLGAQLLFSRSFENADTEGLSLIDGSVRKINAPGMKIPHMGWNSLVKTQDCPLMDGVPENSFVYFVHSYKIVADEKYIAAYCGYGEEIPAIVQCGSVFGIQFHPEKSGGVGLRILENFGRLS